jgi:hypothetical protein
VPAILHESKNILILFLLDNNDITRTLKMFSKEKYTGDRDKIFGRSQFDNMKICFWLSSHL